MVASLVVRAGVVVPSRAMSMRAVASSGPGGQNVNKVASKVELRVDLAKIEGLDEDAMRRLRAACGRFVDAHGCLLVTSQRTRDQRTNLDDAREKVRVLVARSLERPRVRRPTRPSRGAVERRLTDKKHRARAKVLRHDDG